MRVVFAGLFSLSLLSIPSPVRARAPRLVHFEPELVRLEGTLKRQSFLVAPGSGRETSELHWVLELDEPVTVASARGDTRIDARELQLAGSDDDALFNLRGQRVRVLGTLFLGHTRHHFTQVMIWTRATEANR